MFYFMLHLTGTINTYYIYSFWHVDWSLRQISHVSVLGLKLFLVIQERSQVHDCQDIQSKAFLLERRGLAVQCELSNHKTETAHEGIMHPVTD